VEEVNGGYRKTYRVYVDSIEGLLTYEEAKAKQDKEKAEQAAIELAQKNAEMDKAYEDALKAAGVDKIAEYINTYRRDDNFNEDSIVEIARRLTNNRNIKLEKIYTAPNPYAFNTEAVYYCGGLSVQQFLKGQIIAYINSFIRDDGNLIILGSVPDIGKIGNFISNAYLKYTGITTISMSNGGTREVATFSMIFSF
jgi:hypothetical protein